MKKYTFMTYLSTFGISIANIASLQAEVITLSSNNTSYATVDGITFDTDFDGIMDGAASTTLFAHTGDTAFNSGAVRNSILKFELPSTLQASNVSSATLRVHFDSTFTQSEGGTIPLGSVDLFHSSASNNLTITSSEGDTANADYSLAVDNAVVASQTPNTYVDIDVLSQVQSDITNDTGTIVSAFRLNLDNAYSYSDDNQNHYYIFSLAEAGVTVVPELVLTTTTIPEPSSIAFGMALAAVCGLPLYRRRR